MSEKGFQAVLAMSLNRVIGKAGRIPWHISDEFRWFKKRTMGGVLVMGRKTFESIGSPLPGRENIVVSRSGIPAAGVRVVSDPGVLDPAAFAPREVFVIGGREVLLALLPRCTDFYLSVVKRVVDGDILLPEFESGFPHSEVVLRHNEFDVVHYWR